MAISDDLSGHAAGLPALRKLWGTLLAIADRWWAIVELVPRAGPGLVALTVLENLVLGLLPIAFVIGTSTMIARIEHGLQTGSASWSSIAGPLALAGGALLIQNLLSPFRAVLGELVTRRVDGYCVRGLVHASLVDAPMAAFDESDVLSQLNDAQAGLTQYSLTPGSAVVGLLALVTRYSQMLGAVVVLGIVLGPGAAAVVAAAVLIARVGWRDSLTRFSVFSSTVADARRSAQYMLRTGTSPALAKEMRILQLLPWFRARTESDCDAYYVPVWRKRARLCVVPFMVYGIVLVVGISAALIMLRDAMARGSLSVLDLSLALQAIFLAIAFAAFFPEADIPTQFGMQTQAALVSLRRRFSGPSRSPARGSLDAAGLPRSSIRFEDVSFSYPGADKRVLDGLDFELRVGESTAIVGLNGAGKTTLVKLLSRLYEPGDGRILVDGTDLADYDTAGWQRRLAVIFQNYNRYELDARTNVGLGAAGRLDDGRAFVRATERAGAAEIIGSLPQKEETVLSSRYRGGADLSGGQWQRIALARALFAVEAGAAVLVLDEPTAQLDVRAEVSFFDNFLELTRGLTTVIVSHRFSTVRRAGRIVVLEDGKVIEDGRHDDLARAGGRYAQLFALQSSRFADGLPEEPDDLTNTTL